MARARAEAVLAVTPSVMVRPSARWSTSRRERVPVPAAVTLMIQSRGKSLTLPSPHLRRTVQIISRRPVRAMIIRGASGTCAERLAARALRRHSAWSMSRISGASSAVMTRPLENW
ncbi:MAG: hypothetical protein ACRDNZ_24485 [Streptosporangiaceae bacterium]